MKGTVLIIFVCLLSTIVSEPLHRRANRIFGGSTTTIDQYPFAVVILSNQPMGWGQHCGGAIINNRSVMSAAHCTSQQSIPSMYRLRMGSSFANSGGIVYDVAQIIEHPDWNRLPFDSDINIMRSATEIIYIPNLVEPVPIAGANYNVPDNAVVWAIGWGRTETEMRAEQLHHVQIWTINQEICRQRFNFLPITDNMMCVGWLDVGIRDQCSGDSGSPLIHNNVVVGVCSFGNIDCGSPSLPGVNARVSRFTSWILANA